MLLIVWFHLHFATGRLFSISGLSSIIMVWMDLWRPWHENVEVFFRFEDWVIYVEGKEISIFLLYWSSIVEFHSRRGRLIIPLGIKLTSCSLLLPWIPYDSIYNMCIKNLLLHCFTNSKTIPMHVSLFVKCGRQQSPCHVMSGHFRTTKIAWEFSDWSWSIFRDPIILCFQTSIKMESYPSTLVIITIK